MVWGKCLVTLQYKTKETKFVHQDYIWNKRENCVKVVVFHPKLFLNTTKKHLQQKNCTISGPRSSIYGPIHKLDPYSKKTALIPVATFEFCHFHRSDGHSSQCLWSARGSLPERRRNGPALLSKKSHLHYSARWSWRGTWHRGVTNVFFHLSNGQPSQKCAHDPPFLKSSLSGRGFQKTFKSFQAFLLLQRDNEEWSPKDTVLWQRSGGNHLRSPEISP